MITRAVKRLKINMLAGGILLVILTIALGTMLLLRKEVLTSSRLTSSVRPNRTFQQQGVRLEYPDTMIIMRLTSQDTADRFIFRARTGTQDAAALLTVRYEQGIAKAANATKKQPLDLLLENIKGSYPQRYPAYKEEQQRRLVLHGYQAAEVIFTYNNPQGDRVRQRFMIVIKNTDTAYYISGQTIENKYTEINKQVFEPVFSSFTPEQE